MADTIVPGVAPTIKRRGRKPKNTNPETTINNDVVVVAPSAPKKRGRKPKGGKLIPNNEIQEIDPYVKTNVILHLKCSLKKLDEHSKAKKDSIESFSMFSNKMNDLQYQELNKPNDFSHKELVDDDDKTKQSEAVKVTNKINNTDLENINKKLRELQKLFHNNDISDKKSACFWCTCDFDNNAIHIPKFKICNSFHVYGCFCTPECAVAHLMNENIDISIRFERYQLLNYIYGKVYDYKKNIKPSPDPYYTLDKYYGNLSIQEYRKLLSMERLFMVIDKPLTRVLPELYEDINEFQQNNTTIQPKSSYQIKKRKQTQHTKNDIVNENFGTKT